MKATKDGRGYFSLSLSLFRPHCKACRILVLQPVIKPMRPALAVQSLNHWTTREVPKRLFLLCGLGPRP